MVKIRKSFTGTEECLLEVCSDFQPSSDEKYNLLMQYSEIISLRALMYISDRIDLIELMKSRRMN